MQAWFILYGVDPRRKIKPLTTAVSTSENLMTEVQVSNMCIYLTSKKTVCFILLYLIYLFYNFVSVSWWKHFSETTLPI